MHNLKFCITDKPKFEDQLASFQLALFRQQEKGSRMLYEPAKMQVFAEENAPGLWQHIEKAIQPRSASSDRMQLQQQRVVSLLHILAYFRYSYYFLHTQNKMK